RPRRCRTSWCSSPSPGAWRRRGARPSVDGQPLKCALSSAACRDVRYPSLVTVAPLTVSMCALCASSTSWRSCGTAYELISSSRLLPLGTCKVVTSAILPLARRTWTCPGPQRVCATVPLATTSCPEPAGAEPADAEAAREPDGSGALTIPGGAAAGP